MNAYKKIPLILAIIAVALASIVKLTPITTDVEMHKHSIEQIDKEVDSVLKLTAGATAASAVYHFYQMIRVHLSHNNLLNWLNTF